ncbi:conserved hypothetical protein [Ricinus communis]|uniref:Uncharacterized protein n=1 Tax=Ricinus communis TaxID=3988 RepID=B9T7H7_RICCO|nr:conserved hypothetical protein [Ricinus communis]
MNDPGDPVVVGEVRQISGVIHERLRYRSAQSEKRRRVGAALKRFAVIPPMRSHTHAWPRSSATPFPEISMKISDSRRELTTVRTDQV